jgi:DNA-binding NarL/FixJ family response regulator
METAVIIEGNPLFREELEAAFRSRFPSVEVVGAENGKKAMEFVETLPPAFVLIDVKLPDGNGFQLTRKIKDRRPDATIVILSSNDSPEYRQAARMNGGDYFILKESPLEAYFGLIELILSDREQENPEPIDTGTRGRGEKERHGDGVTRRHGGKD